MKANSPDRFVLVGMRFAKYFYDEEVIKANVRAQEISGEYDLTVDEAALSKHKYRGRSVIELCATITFRISVSPAGTGSKKKSRSASKAVDDSDVIALSLTCVGGFVGIDEADDGNLEEFVTHSSVYGRAIYWLARQRVRNITTSTLLNTSDLPWDLGSLAKPEGRAKS